MKILNFFPGTTVRFTVTITIDDQAEDIRNDTVTLRYKEAMDDLDANSILSKEADVTTEGAYGRALFELTPTDTEIAVGEYFWDIEWVRSGGDEYVLAHGKANIKDRVSDV